MNSNSTENRDIRKFGLIAFLFFGCLCVAGLWAKKPLPVCLFGALSLLGIGFLAVPGPLRPVYSAWLKIAHIIGRIVTTLVMAIAYYLVMTPSALIKRVFGGPPLPVRPDENASSYWVPREEPAQPRDRFIKRF